MNPTEFKESDEVHKDDEEMATITFIDCSGHSDQDLFLLHQNKGLKYAPKRCEICGSELNLFPFGTWEKDPMEYWFVYVCKVCRNNPDVPTIDYDCDNCIHGSQHLCEGAHKCLIE